MLEKWQKVICSLPIFSVDRSMAEESVAGCVAFIPEPRVRKVTKSGKSRRVCTSLYAVIGMHFDWLCVECRSRVPGPFWD